MQCTATSKRSKQQCRRHAVIGRQVCMMHGGKTPVGIASPQFKTGRYSSVIPTQIAEVYKAGQEDPDVLGIKEDIHLQTALLQGALEGMSRGEAGELWVKLKEAWSEYKKAQHKPTDTAPEEYLSMVGWLIQEGYQDYMARIELRQMLQERARLVDVEVRRLERARQTVSLEKAMVLVEAIADSVKRNVNDPRALAAIAQDILAITGGAVRRLNSPGQE